VLFHGHADDLTELLKKLRAKAASPAVSDEELLADTPLSKLTGKVRRRYLPPAELEAAMRAWYTYWDAVGADQHAMVPLFKPEMPTVFENQMEHVRKGRYSGMKSCTSSFVRPLLGSLRLP